MPAYPQPNAVGLSPRAATIVQAIANATGQSKSEIVSALIVQELEPAIELGTVLRNFATENATAI